MKPFYLDLLFLPDDLSTTGARAYVRIQHPFPIDAQQGRHTTITPTAVTPNEFDGYIELLKAELDHIRNKAREEFAHLKQI